MLSKKAIADLAKLTKLDVAVIEAAIAAQAEQDLTIEEGVQSFTKTEIEARDNQKKSEGETIGETKGKELAVKTIRTKLGITENEKDPEKVAELALGKINAGDSTLKEQVTLLQGKLSEKDTEVKRLAREKSAIEEERQWLGVLPKNISEDLSIEEHLSILKANLKKDANGHFTYKGQVLRDDATTSPLDITGAVKKFYEDRKGLLRQEQPDNGGTGGSGSDKDKGGRGGSDKTPKYGKFTTQTAAIKDWETKNPGKKWGSEESQEFWMQTIKDNPDIVMDYAGE